MDDTTLGRALIMAPENWKGPLCAALGLATLCVALGLAIGFTLSAMDDYRVGWAAKDASTNLRIELNNLRSEIDHSRKIELLHYQELSVRCSK